jgi:DNA-binding MarR family transcriptional regulator
MNQSDGHASDVDLTFTLLVAAQKVQDRIEAALDEHGLSLAKLNVLKALVGAEKPLSLSEVASRLACVRSNVTQMMDRLEADGLVRRQHDPADRRSIVAVITNDGREREAAGSRALEAVQASVTESLASFDSAHIDQALRSL